MARGSYNTFIHVELGGVTLHQTEDHIMSLHHTRLSSDMTSNVVLTIYDDSAYAIEAKILEGTREFTYSYGYVGDFNVKHFKTEITHVSTEMTAKGMILTIEGRPMGSTQSTAAEVKSYAGMTINEIVSQIAQEQGWKMVVNVPCMPIFVDGSTTELKTYRREGLGAEEFIKKVLIPEAVATDGITGDYEFYLNTLDSGKFAYFLPVGYDAEEIVDTFTFIVGQDNERIISFNADYNKYLNSMIGGNGTQSTVMSGTSNEDITYNNLQADVSDTEIRLNTIIAGSSYSKDEIKALSVNTWNKFINMTYSATLELVGNTNLNPMEYIRVIVLTPSNTLHHTSGRYYINKVEDLIETGTFTTTCELTKINNGSYSSVMGEEANTSNTTTNTTTNTTSANTPVSISGVPDTPLNRVLMSYLGIPYVWGDQSRSGTDCSGLIYMAFSDNNWGSQLAAYRGDTTAQLNEMKKDSKFTSVSQSDLKSGDIVMMRNGGHIGIALGNGKVIHASTSQSKVVVSDVFEFSEAFRYSGYPQGITQVITSSSVSATGFTNSPLVSYKKISPHKTPNRNHAIDTITIHCVVGQLTVESLGNVFSGDRQASSNYGIGSDGRIGLYVDEKDRSYCSSSSSNDHRAVTIEVASDTEHPYTVNETAYNALIDLVADICRRNGIKKLLWKADKSLIGKVDQQNMTVHRWFSNKECPGQFLYDSHTDIARRVNEKL